MKTTTTVPFFLLPPSVLPPRVVLRVVVFSFGMVMAALICLFWSAREIGEDKELRTW